MTQLSSHLRIGLQILESKSLLTSWERCRHHRDAIPSTLEPVATLEVKASERYTLRRFPWPWLTLLPSERSSEGLLSTRMDAQVESQDQVHLGKKWSSVKRIVMPVDFHTRKLAISNAMGQEPTWGYVRDTIPHRRCFADAMLTV